MITKSKVHAIIERETGRSVCNSTPIEDLGIDSLEFLNLMQQIENETGVRVDDSLLPVNAKVGDIVQVVFGYA